MPTCFVIMPITTPEALRVKYGGDEDHFPHVLAHLITPAIASCGYEVIPPKAQGSDVIHANIIQNIEKADMLLCDMSALNANVFFELGVRTALNKPICLVKDDVTTFVPFDLGVINHHTYSSALNVWDLDKEKEALASHFRETQKNDTNTLWKYFSISGTAAPVSVSKADKTDFIIRQIETLRDEMRDLSMDRARSAFDPNILNRKMGPKAARLASELYSARVAQRMSINDVAKAARVKPEVVSSLQNGRRTRRSVALNICMVLGLDPDLVWWRDPTPIRLDLNSPPSPEVNTKDSPDS